MHSTRSLSRAWSVTVVALIVVQIAASAMLRPSLKLTAVSDIVQALLMLTLFLVFLENAVVSRGRLRTVWSLLAACWIFWLTDQCVWLYWDLVLRRSTPEMLSADVLLFLAGVPVIASLLLRPHVEPSARSIRLGRLDFLQLMFWWMYFYAYLVTSWQYISRNADLYNRNFDQLYLVQFLVLLVLLIVLIGQSRGAWKSFYAVFLLAVLLVYISVIAENRALEMKTYYDGSWYDTFFVLALASFVLVAATGRSLNPIPERAFSDSYALWISRVAAIALLSLPVILILTVERSDAPQAVIRFRILLTSAATFVMTALVFAKQKMLQEELRSANRILQEASMTDPLTGIRNRRFFSATIAADVAQSLRATAPREGQSASDLIFYMIDLDNFKEVNDLYGHDAGDQVLIETARRINDVVRTSDVLLRWGGEEFLIVSRLADRSQADALALRVLQAVRDRPFLVHSSIELRRTCSIGWAAFPWVEGNTGPRGYEDVLNLADNLLRQAKREGKDRVIGPIPPRNHG